jgi:hypothetical protein
MSEDVDTPVPPPPKDDSQERYDLDSKAHNTAITSIRV